MWDIFGMLQSFVKPVHAPIASRDKSGTNAKDESGLRLSPISLHSKDVVTIDLSTCFLATSSFLFEIICFQGFIVISKHVPIMAYVTL